MVTGWSLMKNCSRTGIDVASTFGIFNRGPAPCSGIALAITTRQLSPMSRHKGTGYGDRICGAYASQVCIHRQNAVAAVEPDEQVLTGPAQTDNSRSGGQLLIRRERSGTRMIL